MKKQMENLLTKQGLSEDQKDYVRSHLDETTGYGLGVVGTILHTKGWGQFAKKKPKPKKVCHDYT